MRPEKAAKCAFTLAISQFGLHHLPPHASRREHASETQFNDTTWQEQNHSSINAQKNNEKRKKKENTQKQLRHCFTSISPFSPPMHATA